METKLDVKIQAKTIDEFANKTRGFIDLSAAVKYVTKCVNRCILKKELSEEDTSIINTVIGGMNHA